MTNHSGRTGTVTIAGHELPIVSWNAKLDSETVKFKNSKTGRRVAKEATFIDGSGNMAIDWDFDDNAFAAPSNLVVGTVIGPVKCILSGGTGGANYITFLTVIVTSTPIGVTIDGKIASSFNFESDGSLITLPGAVALPTT